MQVWHSNEGNEDQEKLAGIVRVPLDLLPVTSKCLSEPACLAQGIISCCIKQNGGQNSVSSS